MLNTRFNTANLAALGPLLLTFLVELDLTMAWGIGDKLLTAGVMLFMWLVTSVTPDKGFVYKPEATNPNLRAVVWPVLIIGLLMLLQGCSMVPYYSQVKAVADTGIATAVEDRKSFNDKKLAINLVALCDSSIGAVNRLESEETRDFINRLCGGDPGITADALARFAILFSTMQNGQKLELPPIPEGPLTEGEPTS